MTEQAIGSVHYIAPEQAKGDITDGKTDIYSIGVMMYEMLTGKLPFDGENAVSVALMHLQVVPETPRSINPDIPEGIEEITLKAMQKQPGDRYQSAQDMLTDIDRFRMNPSVRFEYKYFYDKQPTKYVDAVNKGKSHRAEEFARDSSGKDEENVRHSLTFPIILGIVIAICLALVVCIPLGIFKADQGTEIADVDVPNLIGKTIQEVNENPDYSFNYEYDYVFSDEYELGTILDQQPSPGSKKIKANGTITLSVNSAQSDVVIPTIYGLNESAARAKLNREGFYKVEVVYVSDSIAEKGAVVRSYPQQGETVSVGESVYLYVVGSDVDELVSVPYVIGYTKGEAVSKLEGLGFTVSIETKESKEAKDTVVTQSPLGGEIPKGSAVVVYVSSGAPEGTVTISVDLPQGVTHSMQLTVKMNGLTDTKTVYGGASTHNFSVTNKGTATVQVLLDDQLYREYKVDFSKETYEVITKNEYIDTAVSETTTSATSADSGE